MLFPWTKQPASYLSTREVHAFFGVGSLLAYVPFRTGFCFCAARDIADDVSLFDLQAEEMPRVGGCAEIQEYDIMKCQLFFSLLVISFPSLPNFLTETRNLGAARSYTLDPWVGNFSKFTGWSTADIIFGCELQRSHRQYTKISSSFSFSLTP